jgi:putative nucleotidyltransferase with HDIG domain
MMASESTYEAPTPNALGKTARMGADERRAKEREEAESLRRAARSMAATLSRVCGVKAFPASVRHLATLASRDAGVAEVALAVEKDPALATRVLRMVNSAAYALMRRCGSVRHAVALLGPARVVQLAQATAALQMVQSPTPEAERLVAHSFTVALVGRTIAGFCGLPADEAFTFGLLHDIGKLLLLQGAAEGYRALLADAPQEPDSVHELEREHYGFDHAALGAFVLASWDMPTSIVQTVRLHHRFDDADAIGGDVAVRVALLRVAGAMAHAFARGEGYVLLADSLADDPACARLRLPPRDLIRLAPKLEAVARDAVASVMPPSGVRNID